MIGEQPAPAQVQRTSARAAQSQFQPCDPGGNRHRQGVVARATTERPPGPKPFVAVNCAALSDTLLESELFGHEKGAFHRSVSPRRRAAGNRQGGTVFLDESASSAAIAGQAARVLRNARWERVGGNTTRQIGYTPDCQRPSHLEEGGARGAFRQDLYYRLNVLSSTRRRCGTGPRHPSAGHALSPLVRPAVRPKIAGIAPEAQASWRTTKARQHPRVGERPWSVRWCWGRAT